MNFGEMVELFVVCLVESSANVPVVVSIDVGKSAVNKGYNAGPRTYHLGTPEKILYFHLKFSIVKM